MVFLQGFSARQRYVTINIYLFCLVIFGREQRIKWSQSYLAMRVQLWLSHLRVLRSWTEATRILLSSKDKRTSQLLIPLSKIILWLITHIRLPIRLTAMPRSLQSIRAKEQLEDIFSIRSSERLLSGWVQLNSFRYSRQVWRDALLMTRWRLCMGLNKCRWLKLE